VAIRKSLLSRVQTVRTELVWLDGRLALADGDLATARKRAKELAGESVAYARAWGATLAAGVAVKAAGAAGAASVASVAEAYQAAADAAGEAGVKMCAAVARWRLGRVLGGDAGRSLVEAAEAWFRSEGGVRRVDAMVRMVDPAAV
jgi:hypothetical protein